MLVLLKKSGKKVPALDKEPKYNLFVDWYLSAFDRLSKGRNWANGERIGIRDIISYANDVGSIDTKEEFIDIIQVADSLFLEMMVKKHA